MSKFNTVIFAPVTIQNNFAQQCLENQNEAFGDINIARIAIGAQIIVPVKMIIH